MTQVLAIGDIHLGRVPRRLSRDWHGWRLSLPETAWALAVDFALESRVDAVLLAGDVIDSASAIYSAFGPLERGVTRLKQAGIPVVAVAGNHDAAFLRHFERIDGLTILGSGGEWNSIEIGDLRVVGWSFRARDERASPLPSLPAGMIEIGRPSLGLLHCDLDSGAGSTNAPVSREELQRAGGSAWLLGHIHRPTPGLAAQSRPIGYLGSLVGLDPTEHGDRGAWLVTTIVDGIKLAFHPLETMRWLQVTAAVDGAANLVDLLARIKAAVESEADRSTPNTVMVARITLTGRLAPECFVELRRAAAAIAGQELDDTGIWIDAVDVEALRPAISIDQVAQGNDVPAILARLLQKIEREEPSPGLTEPAGTTPGWWTKFTDTKAWRTVYDDALSPEDRRRILLSAGYEVLEQLLDQQADSRDAVSLIASGVK